MRHTQRIPSIWAMALVAVACVLPGNASEAQSGHNPNVIFLHPRGTYTGAFSPDSATGRVTQESIARFERLTGKNVFFVHLFVNWLEEDAAGKVDYVPFPEKQCEMIRQHGSVPLITWQANVDAHDEQSGYLLDRIVAGEFDELFEDWAKVLRRHRGPVLLRWGHEMNGNWFSWSGVQNGGDEPLEEDNGSGGGSGPKRFRKAWGYVHDFFRERKVHNVHWVWSVYHTNVVREWWNEMESYWPGADKVHWIGITAINWSTANREDWKAWRGLPDILDYCYWRLTTRFPTKPLFLTEFACANPAADTDGDKAKWITEALRSLPKEYPRIKAISWYDDNVGAQQGRYPANFGLDFAPYRKSYAKGIANVYYKDAPPEQVVPRPKRQRR